MKEESPEQFMIIKEIYSVNKNLLSNLHKHKEKQQDIRPMETDSKL